MAMETKGQITYRQLYEQGAKRLEEVQIDEAKLDARLLLEWCCQTDRNTLLVHGERAVTPEEMEKYEDCLIKRAKHIPLQYITGEQEFMGLTFKVNDKVLIPRQDTEVLVEEVMRHLHDGMKILDMCTGSGCILLSLLHYSNDCQGIGVDISEDALCVARQNRENLNLQAEFIQSDLFEKVEGKFDLIVSNPPYIQSKVIETLMPEVREYEPIVALDGKEDGLYFYREIIKKAEQYLYRGGKLFFEIGYEQGNAVKKLLEEAGYKEVTVIKDFAGLDRVVCAVL